MSLITVQNVAYNYVNTQKCYVLAIMIFIITGTYVSNWYIPPETQSPHLLPPCIITMFNYNECQRVSDMWHSQTFYSESSEYKQQLRVYTNGFGAGELAIT